MSQAPEDFCSLGPLPAVKKPRGSKDGGISVTKVPPTPTAFSGGPVATTERRNSRRDRKSSMGHIEQVPTSLFTTSIAPSQWQVPANTSRKSSSIARTMSDKMGPQGSSSRTSSFASKIKVRFGKISFREYTASVTSVVMQKKCLLITACVALTFLLIGTSMLFLLIIPGEKSRPGGTRTCDSDELDNNLRFDTAVELSSESGGLLFARAYRSCHEFLGTSGDASVVPNVAERLKALVRRFSVELTENTLTEEIVRTSVTEGVDVLFGVDLAVYGGRTYPIITKGKSLVEKLGRQFGRYLSEDMVNSLIQLPNDMVSELVKIDDSVQKTLHGNKPTTELHNISILSKLSLDGTPPSLVVVV
ncbi:hypothetical protein MTO96_008029 [Rhipicephalus appendiculatus]